MELSLQHQHPNTQPQTSSPKPEVSKSVKHSTKVLPPAPIIQPQQSLFFVPVPPPQVLSSFNFHIDGLSQILKTSKAELPNHIVQAISSRKKFNQQRIYQAIVNTSYDFVGVHMTDMGKGLKIQIQSLFQSIHNSVQAGIWDGQYEINKRNNYFTANRREHELVSYITQELVKRNIENFRQQLNQSEASELFKLSSPHPVPEMEKNRQAEEFVRRIKEEQEKHREYIRKLKEEKEAIEVRSMEEQRMKEQEKRREHQTAVRRRIERYSELKTIDSEHKKKAQAEYMSYALSSRKPLYRDIQERYQKRRAEQHKQKFKIMRNLMNERKPITFEEINQHMERYEDLLRENEQYRQQKRELKENQMEIIASRRPYRSKFYSLVVNSTKKSLQAQPNTALIQRQNDFSQYVKKNFVPKTDQAKQQELSSLIKRMSSQKRNGHSRKHIQQGKKNLQKLHLLIGELRAKNKIKDTKPLSDTQIPSNARKYVNYLEEVKQSRIEKSGGEISIDYDKKLSSRHHEQIKLQAMIRQEKAKKNDHYLNSSMDIMDFDSHMKGKTAVENDYLEAARAKVAILKKYKAEPEVGAEDLST